MRAAVCHELGGPLQIEDVVLDPPRPQQVRVRMAAVGVCHSDIHLIQGAWRSPVPLIAGHEGAGIVEEVGVDVTHVAPGDRVIVSMLRSCGRCFYCVSGYAYQCHRTTLANLESPLHTHDGTSIFQGVYTAAFAEEVVVHGSQVLRAPEDMPMESAALLACAVITGVGAVTNTAKVRPGSSVAVIGCGGIGLNAIQGAALVGANPIIALDVLDAKLETARTFGATHVLNAGAENLRRSVRALTDGRGVDYAFITVGSPQAVAQGIAIIRTEGTAVLIGLTPLDVTAPLPIFDVGISGKKILGSLMGETRLTVDVPRLAALYSAGRLKLDELVSGRYDLSDINEAIAATDRGEAIRNVIVLNG